MRHWEKDWQEREAARRSSRGRIGRKPPKPIQITWADVAVAPVARAWITPLRFNVAVSWNLMTSAYAVSTYTAVMRSDGSTIYLYNDGARTCLTADKSHETWSVEAPQWST